MSTEADMNAHDADRNEPWLPYGPAAWPPPEASTRITATGAGLGPLPANKTGRSRRILATAVVAAALVAGLAGYAATNRSSTAPSPSPATAPSAPATGANGTGSPSGDPGVTSTSTTALSVGVVDINTNLAYQGAAAAGTGMLLTSTGEVLTNNHVVDGATSIKVTVVPTGKSYSAAVVGTDPTADVAVVKLKNSSGLQIARIGDSSTLNIGDAVIAVGNAGGVGGAPAVGNGAVTNLDQQITASDPNGSNAEQLTGLIEISAPLQPGESGGPLYDASGRVVGMNTAGAAARRRATSTANYAIPINTALAVVKQIDSGHATGTVTIGTPGFLGVEIDGSPTAQGGPGATISAIVSGTPAEQVGLRPGDLITAIDNTTIGTSATLGQVLRAHHGGDTVSLTWTDASGQSHTASAALIAGPAN
jgi:S1-C subfamily serine protease